MLACVCVYSGVNLSLIGRLCVRTFRIFLAFGPYISVDQDTQTVKINPPHPPKKKKILLKKNGETVCPRE